MQAKMKEVTNTMNCDFYSPNLTPASSQIPFYELFPLSFALNSGTLLKSMFILFAAAEIEYSLWSIVYNAVLAGFKVIFSIRVFPMRAWGPLTLLHIRLLRSVILGVLLIPITLLELSKYASLRADFFLCNIAIFEWQCSHFLNAFSVLRTTFCFLTDSNREILPTSKSPAG